MTSRIPAREGGAVCIRQAGAAVALSVETRKGNPVVSILAPHEAKTVAYLFALLAQRKLLQPETLEVGDGSSVEVAPWWGGCILTLSSQLPGSRVIGECIGVTIAERNFATLEDALHRRADAARFGPKEGAIS